MAWDQGPIEERLSVPARSEGHAEWQRAVRANITASKALNEELAAIGVPFEVGQLAGVRAAYPEAIPLLVKHLAIRDYPEDITNCIVRALTVPYAKAEAFDSILSLLYTRYKEFSSDTLFAIGNALSEIASKRQAEILIEIASDPKYKTARFEPIIKLSRWKNSTVSKISLALLKEDGATWTAIKSLLLLHYWDALPIMESYLDSDNVEIRRIARQFAKKAAEELPD